LASTAIPLRRKANQMRRHVDLVEAHKGIVGEAGSASDRIRDRREVVPVGGIAIGEHGGEMRRAQLDARLRASDAVKLLEHADRLADVREHVLHEDLVKAVVGDRIGKTSRSWTMSASV
jgi:hypothetical protein